MSSQIISPSELDKLLSIYNDNEQEKPRDETPFLRLLAWIEQKKMAHTLAERVCQPGEIIMQEDEPGEVFYLIRSGKAVVFKGNHLTPMVIGLRIKGDAIGEMAILENRPRSATVVALTMLSLWCLDRETLYQLLSENPALGLDLMKMLSERIRSSDDERMRSIAREKKQVEILAELNRQASSDPLTGLFNRRHLEEILEAEIARAQENTSYVGIIMADLDHFKAINDTYGHKAGDLMLQALGKLLKQCVRAADSVFRYGGEEFVIILPGASMQVLSRCAEDIRSRLEQLHVECDGQEIHATISLGIATYPQHGSNGGDVLIRADQALYRAKRAGRNRVTIFLAESGSKSENH
jgi:diguanylate cyclase (GGDEF)-like protein